MRTLLLLGILGIFAVFLAGCTQAPSAPTQPQTEHLCSDGTTIVTDLSQCPQVDSQMLQCQKESDTEDSDGDSPHSTCLFNLAVERENVSICKEIYTSQPDYADYTAAKCGAQIADSMNDPTVCDQLGLSASSECYNQLATSAQDPTICESIKTSTQRDSCIYNYVLDNSDTISDWSICDDLTPGSSDAEYCYYTAAMSTDSTNYCDKLSANAITYTLADCYGNVAFDTGAPTLCKSLSKQSDSDECYYYYATSAANTSTCNYISDPTKKMDCITDANESD
jgi:PBP1b-binding outer membrane lipoprotein LpoB